MPHHIQRVALYLSFLLLRAACKGQNAYRVVVQVRASGSRN